MIGFHYPVRQSLLLQTGQLINIDILMQTQAMNRLSTLVLVLAVALAGRAQGSKPSYNTSKEVEKMSPERYARLYVGMVFGDFSAATPDGQILTNKALERKVTLVLFWYPSLAYSNRKYVADYLSLGALPALRQQHRDFQILSLIPDTSALALFRQQNPDAETYTVGNLASFAKAKELNPGRGMPSCVLVDKYGKIAKTSILGKGLDEQAMADKIRELLLQ
jgi:uncharacterized protein YeaC (DUF1315 family)